MLLSSNNKEIILIDTAVELRNEALSYFVGDPECRWNMKAQLHLTVDFVDVLTTCSRGSDKAEIDSIFGYWNVVWNLPCLLCLVLINCVNVIAL